MLPTTMKVAVANTFGGSLQIEEMQVWEQPLLAESEELIIAPQRAPGVSIIMPFEPKMTSKHELKHRLQLLRDKADKKLIENYTEEEVLAVTEKLEELLLTVDYSTYKRSIAIYASPAFQKIYYLDVAVEEKVTVDDTFEIRDLVYAKKDLHKYLILVLSEDHYRFIIGNTTQFIHIITNSARTADIHSSQVREKTGHYSDASRQKDADLHRFLQLTDNCLGRVLASWDLPLFIIGPERVTGHFRKLSHHNNRVILYITGNYEKAGEHEIGKVLAPYVADWIKVCQQNVLQKLEVAVNQNKLTTGVHNAGRDAQQKNGRLLVLEKNYRHEAVDDIIENVLSNGGDVEFVDEGLLSPYQQMALIRFY